MEYRPSRIYRATRPRWSTLAPTPFGRTGPYVEPDAPKTTSHRAIAAAFFLYFGARLLSWFANQLDGIIAARASEILNGIQHPVLRLLGFAVLTAILVYTAGHAMWSIRRLHDLGRPGWHFWRPAMHFLLALAPPGILGIVIWRTSEMTLVESLGTGMLFGGLLWVLPYSLAFWTNHIQDWRASVEDAPGEPGSNRYGPPPVASAAAAATTDRTLAPRQ